jgi:2-polyprenyl-6-hydroxyphenyl methylase/3-demethylubiquinone-9 3-methyltransferase
MTARVDNDWYDILGDEWWAPHGPIALLSQMNPTRATYFVGQCTARLKTHGATEKAPCAGLRVLDVGCGGGHLAESLARAGAQVSGVDRSVPTIEAARRHAKAAGLAIDYRVADATVLPYDADSFDAVVSSDFLEHVGDRLDAVVAEQARVLRFGGLLGFETINRTWQSRLVLICLGQRMLRLVPPYLHDARWFIRPAEMVPLLAQHGVRVEEMCGLVPARPPLLFLAGYLVRRQSGGFRLGDDLSISYLGYGIKVDA